MTPAVTHAAFVAAACWHALLGGGADVSLADLRRLPPREVAEANCRFAQAHLDWLEDQARTHDPRLWWQWHEEAYELWFVWDDLRCAWDIHRHEGYRLDQLRGVRRRIGAGAYWRGAMPPPVPLWRFVWVD